MEHQYPELQGLDVVVPVMCGDGNRGYNQAALLAKGVAPRYGLQYRDILSVKERYQPMHLTEGLKQKEMEIAGKIGCDQLFDSESILLIDDTYINGVTKRECAQVLKAHGAGEVWSLALRRIVPKEHFSILKGFNG